MSGTGCYVLEKGDYVISINSDSHNILDSKTYTQNSDIRYDADNKRDSDAAVAVNQFGDALVISPIFPVQMALQI